MPAGRQVRDDNVNVTLKVYDILGREVTTLVNQRQNPGNYEVTWDATDVPSGVYFYKLTAGDPESSSRQVFVEVKKMILLK
ncbi:MAG: T9SS type A sorting domain-containing protein [Ignavibacteriales bacterium]|nr:T9SS type A sorting domain-containing protein [Ignavibacteriales bacterium]